jgi:hypothetical protein
VLGGEETAGAEGADDFVEACPPIGSITNASTCSGPIREIAASSAAQLASAAACALAAREVSGAGIFSDSTAIGPHTAGMPASPLRASVCSVAPW